MSKKPEKFNVSFRSAETGRYLFWVSFSKYEWELIEKAAKAKNLDIDAFLLWVITDYIRQRSEVA